MKYMIERQISIFDKPKVKLIEDCTNVHHLLTKDSIQDVFMEKDKHYIIYLDNVFYGIYKSAAIKIN